MNLLTRSPPCPNTHKQSVKHLWIPSHWPNQAEWGRLAEQAAQRCARPNMGVKVETPVVLETWRSLPQDVNLSSRAFASRWWWLLEINKLLELVNSTANVESVASKKLWISHWAGFSTLNPLQGLPGSLSSPTWCKFRILGDKRDKTALTGYFS